MNIRTHWIVDEFSPGAPRMRGMIDEHFDDAKAAQGNFSNRAIWNYWFIDKTYVYLRTRPELLMQHYAETFTKELADYMAVTFGMVAIGQPFLSMYVSGCGQEIHNDAANGRLAYVFSLTRWDRRRFDGGETQLFRINKDSHFTQPGAGVRFYEMVEPVFNRLLIFDDRIPHGVRRLQGTMDPHDARFVIHGHFREPQGIAYAEGGLDGMDLRAAWQEMHEAVRRITHHYQFHGFVTVELHVESGGRTGAVNIKHAQLLPLVGSAAASYNGLLREMQLLLMGVRWPQANTRSLLVTALASDNI